MVDAGIEQQQRSLAQVVQKERRKHERKPRQADRMAAEMSHVRVQRLAAGDDEEHGAKHRESGQAVVAKKTVGMARIERPQHCRRAHDPHDPQR